MKLVSFIAIFGSVTVSLLTILKPESPRVFTSIAVHPHKLPLPLKAVAAVIHLLINSYHYYALCLQTSSIFLLAHDITLIIRQLLVLNIGSPQNFNSLVKNYRALAVLQANYASIYRHWMSIMELANVVVVILNVYQAVIVRSYRALVLAFTVGTGFCWTLKQLAGVYEASRDVLFSAQRRTQDIQKWGRKFLRSCRPINIPVGSFFYVDRPLILTVLSIVINSSASLILTHQ